MEHRRSDDADFNEKKQRKKAAASSISHLVLQEGNKLEMFLLSPPCTLCCVSVFVPFFSVFDIFPGTEEIKLLRCRPLP